MPPQTLQCESCDFRSNQKSGLKCHENSVQSVFSLMALMTDADCFPYSLKKRLPCRDPNCDRDFSDPSTLSRHMTKRHKSPSKKRGSLLDRFHKHLPYSLQSTPQWLVIPASENPESTMTTSQVAKVERLSPDVSSASTILHTFPVGRQEEFSCQNPHLDSKPFRFTPSPILPAEPHQPDWQSQWSSVCYSTGSGMDFPCSTAMPPGPRLSLPETNLEAVIPPCGFQIGVGMPNAYDIPSTPAEQSSDSYFLEMPMDGFLAQSSPDPSFDMGPNTMLPGPSHMVPPLTNFDATRSSSDFLCEASQMCQADPLALNFGYGDPLEIEYP
jgi:hypothetical protein